MADTVALRAERCDWLQKMTEKFPVNTRFSVTIFWCFPAPEMSYVSPFLLVQKSISTDAAFSAAGAPLTQENVTFWMYVQTHKGSIFRIVFPDKGNEQ